METMTFEEWYKAVDQIVSSIVGVGVDDAADWPSRDTYESGESPEMGAMVWADSQDYLHETLLAQFEDLAEG